MKTPELSLVIPARDEEANLPPLVAEIETVFPPAEGKLELVIVDDGSRDGTSRCLAALAASRPWLRAFHFANSVGQSAALGHGFRVATAPFVATHDADLQNAPADLVAMLVLVCAGKADFVQGIRVRREDTFVKRQVAAIGRLARRVVLGDLTRDTGCATRLFAAALARELPLQLRGMHRFLPHLARLRGARVVEMPVAHRPRHSGRSHYGVLARGASGLVDLLAVRWMSSRWRDPAVTSIEPGP